MKIASVQLKAHNVWEYQEAEAEILDRIDLAAEQGAELVVLPECAYPAYFLELDPPAASRALERTQAVLDRIAQKARDLHVYVALGIALPEGGKLYNAAVLFDDEGKILHRACKSNLWHFDDRCFTPGEDFQTVETKFGRLGMMVCADGRIPEIARILALQGAQVIIDVVNLVATAQSPKDLMNQQYAFMLPVRAMENGVWLVTADKCGMEGNCAVYLGRSMVIDPAGQIVAECPPDREEILFFDINVQKACGCRRDRQLPEGCGVLCTPTRELEIYRKTQEVRITAAEGERLIAAVQFRAESAEDYLEKARGYIIAGQRSYCKTIVLPPYDGEAEIGELSKALQESMEEESAVVFAACRKEGRFCAAAITRQEIRLLRRCGERLEIMEHSDIGYCVIYGEEAYVPEIPRSAMLLGGEILIWMDSAARPMDTKVAQTRAAENKVFLVRASSAPQDISYLAAPGGGLSCTTFRGAEQLASAMFLRADGLSKAVYPGTDIVKNRIPDAYKELIR